MKTCEFKIEGMTCEHCATSISKNLDTAGVKNKTVSYPKKSATVLFDENVISETMLCKLIEQNKHYKVISLEYLKVDISEKHLIIIGGGSAAFAATIAAKEQGVRVTMINSGLPIGGTCVNIGCVPSKTLLRASQTIYKANHNPFNGINSSAKIKNFRDIISDKKELVLNLRQQKYIDIIKNMTDFRLVEGMATLVSNTAVKVKDEIINATHILIATGSKSLIPDIKGLNHVNYLTNKEAFELEMLPLSVIVVGGSYIALEIAQMFSRLGSNVTILQRSSHILSKQQKDISDELTKHFRQENIKIITNNNIQEIYEKDNQVVVVSYIDNKQQTFKADKLVMATGREANTQNMNLENLGVKLNKNGSIIVDEFLQTSVDNIYAAGDVIGTNMFVYTAAYEGKLAVNNIFSTIKKEINYNPLPWVIFTDPQIAGVGLDEIGAKEQSIDYEVALLPLSYIPRAIAARDTRGFIKLFRNKANDKLIGARIVASEGSELLMQISQAIKFGITISDLKDMLFPYLTMSEGIKLAAITFSKDIKELSCCAT